jgi:hypothetical protein
MLPIRPVSFLTLCVAFYRHWNFFWSCQPHVTEPESREYTNKDRGRRIRGGMESGLQESRSDTRPAQGTYSPFLLASRYM